MDNSFIELSDRVLREKMAHTDNDVLESSWKLKRLFRHLITSPTMARLECDFGKYLMHVRGLRVLDMIEGGWHSHNTYYGLVSAPVAVITSVFLRPFDNNFLLRLADWVESRVNRILWMRPFNQYVLLNLVRK